MRRFDDLNHDGASTSTCGWSYRSVTLTAREVCSKAENGDAWARLAVEHVGYYLGLGVANLVRVIAQQIVMLGGSVMKSAPLFLDRIHEVIRQNCRLIPHERMEVTLALLGPRCRTDRSRPGLAASL